MSIIGGNGNDNGTRSNMEEHVLLLTDTRGHPEDIFHETRVTEAGLMTSLIREQFHLVWNSTVVHALDSTIKNT